MPENLGGIKWEEYELLKKRYIETTKMTMNTFLVKVLEGEQEAIYFNRTTDGNNPLRPNKEIMKLADKFNGETILGASYLPPGCFHDLVGAPVYLIGMLGAPSQTWVGDPRGSQDYYKGAPMAVRRELPCTLESPECRSVKNPVEAGNVFCASVEGGYRGAGKKHSTPAEEGGNEQGGGRVKCIPQGRGGQEGSHKGAVSQVGGYNVFHSTEGRHRGTAGVGVWKGSVQTKKCKIFWVAPACITEPQTGPAQAPKSQNNPALAGVTCDNTGSIQPNRRVLPQKKEWVVPGRDIATGGSSQGLGAYPHHHQDGDPLRVVISDIHNHPKYPPIILPSVSDARLSSIEPAPLRGGADFGPAVVENQQDDGDWIPVTRSTARTHRPHSALGGSIPRQNTVAVPTAQASTPSTVVRATNEMSREDYEALARRYQAMADDARSAAEISDTRVEQASHSGVLGDSGSLGDSLGNQGNIISGSNVAIATEKQDGSSVELLVPISPISSPVPGPREREGEKDFQEQRDAFENYAEINRVLKEETITTPPDFFDDLRDPELSGGSPPAVTGNPHIVFQSGQTKDEKIAELEARLSYFEQRAPKKPVISEPKKSQTKTVVDDYITKLVRPDLKLKKPNTNHVRMTPGRIAIGSTLDKHCGDGFQSG
ncbi:hypothetical protein B0H14DRAFT_3736161 [Mycena olivaceomarginata]|nr:hypothetical protein B0H14DRAFT_3736161 [Mycena olivaceomarginata]